MASEAGKPGITYTCGCRSVSRAYGEFGGFHGPFAKVAKQIGKVSRVVSGAAAQLGCSDDMG